MKSLSNAKRGFTSVIATFVLEKKDEAKQIVGNHIKFAQSQVWDFEIKREWTLFSKIIRERFTFFLNIVSVLKYRWEVREIRLSLKY